MRQLHLPWVSRHRYERLRKFKGDLQVERLTERELLRRVAEAARDVQHHVPPSWLDDPAWMHLHRSLQELDKFERRRDGLD